MHQLNGVNLVGIVSFDITSPAFIVIKKYSVLPDITKNNLIHLKNVTNLKQFTNIMFEICGDLDDLDNNCDFFHINMNNINF